MTTFDLHFHANVHGLKRSSKARRMLRHVEFLKTHPLDYLASTEHGYKNPLEAYQRLADSTEALDTTIIPGVEAVSSEGIDIIFLYRNEADLKCGLPHVKSFAWSVRDVKNIRRNTGALAVVPHPFHISVTAAGSNLSKRAYKLLLENTDYIEVHNGSALTLEKRLKKSCTKPLFPQTIRKMRWTLDLPMHQRGRRLGWSIGSDAHFPGEQYIVGKTDAIVRSGEDVFDFLGRRVRFEQAPLMPVESTSMGINYTLLRSFCSTLKEGTIKRYRKAHRHSPAFAQAMLGCFALHRLF